ncbi:cellobiose phosphorylase [Saccharibacillus sp. CPCC 101409]|uniref:cellobiose phosphorylase n=1 Tax=Saccharibacillus sp. CPCC 101409 TaxID=3058041 RepID=UPI002671AFC4|nr:cellobiose phosphorylase [Saccharibacillus sp. CPCC 101409]MDO3411722.1 cellobiose phosphorylase [Saccharibacillus sp. CPCC 101409]
MSDYRYEDPYFVIDRFDQAKTFSSFLPGLAGIKGIPLWTFYVNRGQAIASFGVRDKNSPILEFSPANIGYKTTDRGGFRTFLRLNGSRDIYEPFRSGPADPAIRRTMRIGRNELRIEEIHDTLKLKTEVVYFNVPNDDFAALARRVTLTNLSEDAALELEMVDGLPEILPYGVSSEGYKAMGNLLRSWMEVYNREHGVPFYRVRSSTGDEAEVSEVTSGHFYLAFGDDGRKIAPIVDFELLFGPDTSLSHPTGFAESSAEELAARPQITANKVPCGFAGRSGRLEAGASLNLHTLVGHAGSVESINGKSGRIASPVYFEQKRIEASELTDRLTDDIATSTSSALFDAYCRQSYLDNFLRGGYPLLLGKGEEAKVYHLFSRKHGDPERDYNFFTIEPEYYSQGNGNFRDMNQNRRSDVFFHPDAGAFNVYMFFSLMQADGYNPLQVKGSTFRVPEERLERLKSWLEPTVGGYAGNLAKMCLQPFTPGKIVRALEENGVEPPIPEHEFLERLLSFADQQIEANFGEGYWIDHWTYNMDLVDSYEAVFPDRIERLLFEPDTCTFFDGPVRVLPRREKTVLSGGEVRQYGATAHDEEKLRRLGRKPEDTAWLRTERGEGRIYRTNLFVKLLSLSLNKMSLLDPYGMGIEMEADKPGWNDAMNGLPGLFGSGMGETFELRRIVEFVARTLESLREREEPAGRTAKLPAEMTRLLRSVRAALTEQEEGGLGDFACWDLLAAAREAYREEIRFGIDGAEEEVPLEELLDAYRAFLRKLDRGEARATELGGGLVPTYFRFEAESHEPQTNAQGDPVIGSYGLPLAVVTSLRAEPLPAFLEGPMHALKTAGDQEHARELHRRVRESGLYDEKLRMYKTSVSLEGQGHEIGRIRAFTPGWLERESIFLHMSYKYLLELLKSGLHDEFYAEFKDTLVPFRDPAAYGRSTLENSSFIASSVNPDPSVHGRGYVARLSGSTAEFLSIWRTMMTGTRPFRLDGEGRLVFKPEPVLPDWLFDAEGRLSFRFLGTSTVTYRGERRGNTYGENALSVRTFILTDESGGVSVVEGGELTGEAALAVREGRYPQIGIVLG